MTGFDELFNSGISQAQQQRQQRKYFIIVKLNSGEVVQKTYPTVDQAAQARQYYLTRQDIVQQVSRIGTL